MDGREFFDEAIAAGRAALDRQGQDGDVPVDDLIAAVYALDMLADQLRALARSAARARYTPPVLH